MTNTWAFVRYGIEGIAQTYEDPFGVAKIDINIQDVVEDTRREVEVLLGAWLTQEPSNAGMFRPRRANETPRSDASSVYESGEVALERVPAGQVRFVVNDSSDGNYKDDEPMEIRRVRTTITPDSTNLRERIGGSSTTDYYDLP